jgi:hypothetical protein
MHLSAMRHVLRSCAVTLTAVAGLIAAEQASDPPQNPHGFGLGLIPPSVAERAAAEAAFRPIMPVRANALRLQRLQAERLALGLEPVAMEPVGAGSEVEFAGSAVETDDLGKQDVQGPVQSVAAQDELPFAVDNSQLSAFPPIGHQGSLGTCVSWALGYYAFSYEYNLVHGLDGKASAAHRFSPRWLYNLTNFGLADAGGSQSTIFSVLQRMGALTMAEFPNNGDFVQWPAGKEFWRAALTRRAGTMTNATPFDITAADIPTIKALVANGRVLPYATHVQRYAQKPLGNDPGTPDDDGFAGQQVCPWLTTDVGSNAGHQMTIVGYHDELWYDADADGSVDPGEKGAFKVANSWGTGDWNAGFRWVLYDAFLANTAYQLPIAQAKRMPATMSPPVWLTVNQTPVAIQAEITVRHVNRREFILAVGSTTAMAATTPGNQLSAWNYSQFPGNNTGNLAFSGGPVGWEDYTFVFDLREFTPLPGQVRRVFLGVKDYAYSTNGITLKAFHLTDAAGTILASSGSVPCSHTAGVDSAWYPTWAWLDIGVPDGNQPPAIGPVAVADPGALVLP